MESEVKEDSFWQNNQDAQAIFQNLSTLKRKVTRYQELTDKAEELALFLEMSEEAEDDTEIAKIQKETETLRRHVDQLEIEALLSGKYDHLNCFVNFQ